MTNSYTFEDYNKITFEGIAYQLPENVLNILAKLMVDLESTVAANAVTTGTVSSDPKYKKPAYNNNNQKQSKNAPYKNRMTSNDDWNTPKHFKTTVMEKKEGVDKLINDVRICLNKISNKNYDTQKQLILEHIHNLINNEIENLNMEEDLKKITTAIFEIASNNIFYSEIYADLYKELFAIYPIFGAIFDEFMEKYKDSIHTIEYVDQNVDYNKFCDNNKLNDKRKAISTFLVNLMKINVVTKTVIINNILHLQELVIQYVDQENKNINVDEITENLFILVTQSNADCQSEESWAKIVENVKKCSQMKSKEKKSISSRAVFRYMDILDAIKKK